MINVKIDSAIHLNPNDLAPGVLEKILGELTVINPAKKSAEREMLWNAKDIPSHLKLYRFNGHNELMLPRGALFECAALGISEWNDQRTYDNTKSYHLADPYTNLRDYQDLAVQELFTFTGGVYKAPTGSGKTTVMLELIRCCDQKTIVLCEKFDIAQQWMNSADELGFKSVGLINEGNTESDADLIIAMRQSVYAADLAQGWFDRFGCVVVDECHHCSAETMFELVQRFPAYFRYGCSATPDTDPDLFPIARAVIGPVVAQSTPEQIGEHLVIPSVRVVKTSFDFPYRPTERRGKKVIRNNYKDMMYDLEKDFDRNRIITREVMREANEGNVCLVLSQRKKHLDELYNAFISYPRERFMHVCFYTGETAKNDDITDLIKHINECDDPVVIFSTLAEEGTNIPRLDRLFLTYPGRKLRGFEQAIGRIMRTHPKKTDAVVYDFRDINVPLLNSQFRERAQMIYNKKGYKVETVECPE